MWDLLFSFSLCTGCMVVNSGAHILMVPKFWFFQKLYSESYLNWVNKVGGQSWQLQHTTEILRLWFLAQLKKWRALEEVDATGEGRALDGSNFRLLAMNCRGKGRLILKLLVVVGYNVMINDVSSQGQGKMCVLNVLNFTNVKLHSLHLNCVCFMWFAPSIQLSKTSNSMSTPGKTTLSLHVCIKCA